MQSLAPGTPLLTNVNPQNTFRLVGGSAALSYLVPGQWESLLMWAYSATKTRTISFDLEEVSHTSDPEAFKFSEAGK